MDRRKSATCLIMTALMLCSVAMAPVASAQAPTRTNETAWGLSYDWSNIDEDVEAMTGISYFDILDDFMAAADDAGFELNLGHAVTGSTHMYMEQWDEENRTYGDGATPVTGKVTQVTVRHASLNDMGLYSEWTEGGVHYDIAVNYDEEQLFTLDITYTEYLDADGRMLGMDADIVMNMERGTILDIAGKVKGGGETIPFDLGATASVAFSINSAHVEVELAEPSNFYNYLDDMDGLEGDVEWHCDFEDGATQSYDFESYGGEGELEVEDVCDSLTGDYSSSANYEITLTGLEDLAGEFGMTDALDVSITDSFTSAGTLDFDDDEIFLGNEFWLSADTENIVADDSGTPLEVQKALGFPAAVGMPMTVAWGFMGALGESGETFIEAFEDDLDDFGAISGDGEGDYYICDNGEEIPADWVNDGYEDCMDGTDEGVEDWEEPETEEELNDKFENLTEAWSDSSIETVAEAFSDSLENRMDDYVASTPYDDGDGWVYYDASSMRFVGAHMIAIDDGDEFSFIGPAGTSYADAPTSIHVQYLVGSAASTAQEVVVIQATLPEIMDEAEHNTSVVDETLAGTDVADERAEDNPPPPPPPPPGNEGGPGSGIEDGEVVNDEEGGMIPFLSPLAILSTIALAGILLRREDEA